MSPVSVPELLARDLAGTVISWNRARTGPSNEVYLPVSPDELAGVTGQLAIHQYALIALFAAENFEGQPGTSLLYAFQKREQLIILICASPEAVPSLARTFPSASWFERECRDGFGTTFTGAFDTRRLFLHETYPEGFHPLKKSFDNAAVATGASVPKEEEYPFRCVEGEGIYQVPVGPVHAGIIEPGHFRFSVIGETIFNLEIRMFYKHRGIEKLAEGRTPTACLPVAEAVSGDESVANAVLLCMATERISGISVPDRAWCIRTLFLELERIVSHLNDQAGMLVDVAFPLGASQFAVLREELVRWNETLSGSRFLRGTICIGGIVRDVQNDDLTGLAGFLEVFRKRYQIGLRIVLSTSSVIERFATTGCIDRSLVVPLALSGPVARASGSPEDARVQHPYGIYDRYPVPVKSLFDGDVLSRFTIKSAEILASLDLIGRILKEMPTGPVAAVKPVKDGCTLALIESARGQNLCWLWIRNGKIERYKMRTASFCNWQALEHAVQGNILPDFPVINKSLNLSYAGTDL